MTLPELFYTKKLFLKVLQHPQENTCVGVAFLKSCRLQHRCFSCEYCEILKNTYFEEHLRTAASVDTYEHSILRLFLILHRLPVYVTFIRIIFFGMNDDSSSI